MFVSGFVFYGSGFWNFFAIRIRILTKDTFFKGNNKILGEKLSILLNRELSYGIILKISENHEKFAEKVDFYSSISLAGSGSGFRIRIRIQPGDLNPDPQHWEWTIVFPSFRFFNMQGKGRKVGTDEEEIRFSAGTAIQLAG